MQNGMLFPRKTSSSPFPNKGLHDFEGLMHYREEYRRAQPEREFCMRGGNNHMRSGGEEDEVDKRDAASYAQMIRRYGEIAAYSYEEAMRSDDFKKSSKLFMHSRKMFKVVKKLYNRAVAGGFADEGCRDAIVQAHNLRLGLFAENEGADATQRLFESTVEKGFANAETYDIMIEARIKTGDIGTAQKLYIQACKLDLDVKTREW